MKYCAIPAQITTVEDKIAGNLSFKQIILLSAPLFTSAAIYFGLPPFAKFYLYKVIIFAIIALFSGALSLRINGQIILDWIVLLLRYESRPRIYVNQKTYAVPANLRMIDENYPNKQMQQPAAAKAGSTFLKLSLLASSKKHIFNYDSRAIYRVTKSGGLDVFINSI